MSQLPLELRLNKNARFENFVPDGNTAAVAHLKAAAEGQRTESLWLWGAHGAGKSHLLQAACRRAGESGLRTMYLNLADELVPESLDGLTQLDLLAVDEIGQRAEDSLWQRPLFTLFNEFNMASGTLVAAASSPPSALKFILPDLASRACGAVVYRLQPLDDDGQLRALLEHAQTRGLQFDTATAAYLFTRVKRDMRELCRWLDHIDQESLAAQRRVTIPFLRELLQSSDGELRGKL